VPALNRERQRVSPRYVGNALCHGLQAWVFFLQKVFCAGMNPEPRNE